MRLIDADVLLQTLCNMPDVYRFTPGEMQHLVQCTPTMDFMRERNTEKLTDIEQRIFLAAMGREEKVCKKVDSEWLERNPHDESLLLLRTCREIERKVKGALWTK